MKRISRTTFCLLAVATIAALVCPIAVSRADHGVLAQDITGKFVSFQDGILTINVTHGKLAGTHSIPIADGLPVIFYATPERPQTLHSPGAFANATPDMPTRVTIDIRMRVSRIQLGSDKPTKNSKKNSG